MLTKDGMYASVPKCGFTLSILAVCRCFHAVHRRTVLERIVWKITSLFGGCAYRKSHRHSTDGKKISYGVLQERAYYQLAGAFSEDLVRILDKSSFGESNLYIDIRYTL